MLLYICMYVEFRHACNATDIDIEINAKIMNRCLALYFYKIKCYDRVYVYY